jgi:TfoX/Sxy family transcriptional regulator of competence genes
VAYDEALAERIRPIIGVRSNVSERNMFGGLAFMVGDHMALCVTDDELLVRVDREDADRVLAEPHVRVFDMTGRPMRGFVVVDAEGIAEDAELAKWVDAGADFASSLPPKAA